MDADEWDERYGAFDLVWSAGPNQFVVEACGDLPPGRMIDLAAGEGRNALWFADQGWDATAVDYSEVAIDKVRASAERRGVELNTVVADLVAFEPEPGGYDLVVVAYLHLPADQLDPILARAAAAVAPGGVFFLIGHDVTNLTDGYGGPQSEAVLTSPKGVVGAIGAGLEVERAEVVERHVEADEGLRVARDTLVFARRRNS